MNRLTYKRLVDKMIDAYVEWREACQMVNEAYRGWASAKGLDAALAFEWYTTSLEREERAAHVYARLVRRVGQPVATPPAVVGDARTTAGKARPR